MITDTIHGEIEQIKKLGFQFADERDEARRRIAKCRQYLEDQIDGDSQQDSVLSWAIAILEGTVR